MFGINRGWTVARTFLISGLLLLNLWGCSNKSTAIAPAEPPAPGAAPVRLIGKISEVSPPEVIQELRQALEKYQPQVAIVSPRPGEVLQDDTVSVRLQVKDLPLFKDEKLGLGPHLHVFLDNQPYQAVYDTSEPLTLKDLPPGTHTIRVFAGRPWHESFKNDGAYAQTTFHVFTKTLDNNPNSDLPLLTYSRPQGSYGAEPILLDFYLTNAPLHLVAGEDEKDDVVDWRIKVTVNGESFVVDRWQPLYLKGFKPGKNWVQLEYIDEKGNPVQNVYNNTAHVFTYEPNGKDILSQLSRGDLTAAQARSIVDQNYKLGEPEPTSEPSPTPESIPVVPTPAPEVRTIPELTPTEQPVEETKPATAPKETKAEEPKAGFFNRFRRAKSSNPSPGVTPEPIPEPTPSVTPEPSPSVAPSVETIQPAEETPEVPAPVEKTPKGGFFDRFRRPEAPKPSPSIVPEPSPAVAPLPEEKIEEPQLEPAAEKVPELPAPAVKEAPKGGFFDRFRRPAKTPKPSPSVAPEPIVEEPVGEIEEAAPEVTEPAEPQTPEVPVIQPRSELERRLGIPLNPPVMDPVLPNPVEVLPSHPVESPEIKLVEPKPFEPFQPGRSPNQLRRSAPESLSSSGIPIKLPETLEAPSEEAIPIPAIQ